MIQVQEKTQPGEARRAAVEMAQGLGFDEETTSNMAVIVTEAATNVIKHGGGGEIVLRPLRQQNNFGIEILALDRGSGMDNVGRCFQDGYTTGTSPGNGLGAIARLSTLFDVYSSPKAGTVLLSQLWKHRETPAAQPVFEWGAVSVPMAGQTA